MQLTPLTSINGRHVNKQKPFQGQGCLYTILLTNISQCSLLIYTGHAILKGNHGMSNVGGHKY